jgi:hypothetical protein
MRFGKKNSTADDQADSDVAVAPAPASIAEQLDAAYAERDRLANRRRELSQAIESKGSEFASIADRAIAGDDVARARSRELKTAIADLGIDIESVDVAIANNAAMVAQLEPLRREEAARESLDATKKIVAQYEDEILTALGEAFTAARKMFEASRIIDYRIEQLRDAMSNDVMRRAVIERGSMARITNAHAEHMAKIAGVVLPIGLFTQDAL